jgi:type II secretory pathway predicted ATPase ExeA
MNTPTIDPAQKRRLQAHYGFTGMPFRKNVKASKMFDSSSQRELLHALLMWLELRGVALVTGPSGVGKSITIRRFLSQLPAGRYDIHRFGQVPTRARGFLRALSRRLGLQPRAFIADMFDNVRDALSNWSAQHGAHPLLVMDDAEGMTASTLDLVRRLTADQLDAEDHFSVLLVGTEDLLTTLRGPSLEPLRTRFRYTHALRPFTLEDTRNYIAFHVRESGGVDELFSDDAVRALFGASMGTPRAINQLALQAMITAAVRGIDQIDGKQMQSVLHHHPLYESRGGRP